MGPHGIRVHTEHDWVRGLTRVHLVDGHHLIVPDHPLTVQRVPLTEGPAGEPARPLLELPDAYLAAIVAAAGDVLPPDRAQAAHLADTIAVRDRLLALVEHTTRT